MVQKHSLKTILIESVFILISILIAFLLNDWRERSNKETLYFEVIENVKTEINKNIDQIEQTLPQQLEQIIKLQNYVNDPKIDFKSKTLFEHLVNLAPRGLRTPLLNDAAWEFANQSGLFNKNVQLHYQLSSIYKQQNIGVNKTIPRITNFIMQESNFSKNKDVKAAFQLLDLLVREVIGQERELLKRYKEVLTNFKIEFDSGVNNE